MPDHNENGPKAPAEVAGDIRNHMLDCRGLYGPDDIPEPYGVEFSLEDYKRFCNDAMRGVKLEPKIDIPDGPELKEYFPAGKKCCIAVIPVTPRGMKFEMQQLEDGDYQTRLIVEPAEDGEAVEEEITTQGFGSVKSRIFDMLPPEFRADISEGGCTFIVPKYDKKDQVTKDDRDRIAKLYEQAFRNAKKLLSPNQ